MTALPAPGSQALYIVDLSGYVFRAYHAIQTPLTSPSGETTHAVMGAVTMIQRVMNERRPSDLVVAMDSRTPSFRKERYPEYKANRPPPPEDLRQQMIRCREISEAYGMPIAQKDGVEADDVIATLVRRSTGPVVILSADKDLMQLVDERVVLWDTMRNRVYGPPEVKEKLGVRPDQVRDFLALTGDSSDNVPGVAHVGPKTAVELLEQFGTLDGVYAGLETITKKKLKETLTEHKAEAYLSQELVTLKEDVEVPSGTKMTPRDEPRLRQLFTELGFGRLLAQLGPDPSAPADRREAKKEPPPIEKRTFTHEIVADRAALEAAVALAVREKEVALHVLGTHHEAMRADVVGIAFAFGSRAIYVPSGHRVLDGADQLPLADALAALAPLFASEVPRVLHDAKHELVLLSRHGVDAAKGPIFDVMLASFLLDPEARNDVEALVESQLGRRLPSPTPPPAKGRAKAAPLDEQPVATVAPHATGFVAALLEMQGHLASRLEAEGLVDVLTKVDVPLSVTLAGIERTGVRVDTSRLAEIGRKVDAEIARIETQAYALAGKEFNLASPRQLETLLFDELGLRVVKRTKTSRSTDAEVLEALSEDHDLPAVILEHRQLSKLKGTYIEALPSLVNPKTGRIHTTFAQAVAATGRLSSVDPNLQNIPIRTDLGRAIRSAFVPEPGKLILSADYSQIELRVLAHLSKDPVLVSAFTNDEDIHTRTAMEIFDKKEDEILADERRAAKTINFGVIYGMGESALAKRLGIPRKEAAGFIARYFERYAGVRKFLDGVVGTARATGSVQTMAGRRRFLPDLSSANRALRLQAERIAQNTPIQGSAADILKAAMIALTKPVVAGSQMILTVHDELVFEVPEADVEPAGKVIRETMEGVWKLAVPLVVHVGWGKDWGESH